MDASVEGLPRPVPPQPVPDPDDDTGDNPDAHVVEPEQTGFIKFVADHKALCIFALVIFILIVIALGVAFYMYDRKKRKQAVNHLRKKNKRFNSYDTDGDRYSDLDDSF